MITIQAVDRAGVLLTGVAVSLLPVGLYHVDTPYSVRCPACGQWPRAAGRTAYAIRGIDAKKSSDRLKLISLHLFLLSVQSNQFCAVQKQFVFLYMKLCSPKITNFEISVTNYRALH